MTRQAAEAWGMLMGEADRLVEEQLEREARLKLIHGSALDVLATLPDESVHCCVTSPPYYGKNHELEVLATNPCK